jgi:protein involved in polysaccharide export with SLBB domain
VPARDAARWILLVGALLGVLTATPAPGQESLPGLPTGPEIPIPKLPSLPARTSGATEPAERTAGRALEGALVDTLYHVGPGDRFLLVIGGPVSVQSEMQVDLEGNVLLPDAQVVAVSGRTLAETRRRVLERVRASSPRAEIILSLVEAREFRVFLTGVVSQAGSYRMSGVDRVSDLVMKGGPAEAKASTRNISVTHRDGTITRADLQRFAVSGKLDANPFLQDGDRVTVPYLRATVEIFGAVNAPSLYELVEDEHFSDVLLLAGGLRIDALADTVCLVRYREDEEATSETRFHYPAEDPTLRPRDQVFVRSRPTWTSGPTVTVLGEFTNQMVVPIVEGITRVSDVVRSAGGFTEDAAIDETRLTRTGRNQELIRDLEFERLKLVPIPDMNPDEYAYYKMKLREKTGKMQIDFRRVLADATHPDNIFLERDDVLYAPPLRRFVQVTGEVASPGNVTFDPNLRLQDYVSRAGGYAWNARKSKLTLIRATTGEWLRSPGENVKPEPGDIIWVPENPQRSFWPVFKDVLMGVSQAATVVLLVRQVTK